MATYGVYFADCAVHTGGCLIDTNTCAVHNATCGIDTDTCGKIKEAKVSRLVFQQKAVRQKQRLI